jgi:transcriptional regulator with XRE-family HTH domain
MNCNEKDHKILKAIKAFRLARYVKQSTMAEALGINQTQYSRIEAGQRSLTLQHIRVISDTLKVPELLFWAMSMDEIQLKNQNSVLSQVLLEFVYLTENIKPDAPYFGRRIRLYSRKNTEATQGKKSANRLIFLIKIAVCVFCIK